MLVEEHGQEEEPHQPTEIDLLANSLLDGPYTRDQVHQIALRLVELSAPSTQDNALSRLCRYGESIDEAARSVYRFLTQDDLIAGSSRTSESHAGTQHSSESGSTYCEVFDVPTERRRTSWDKMRSILAMHDSGATIRSIRAKYPKYHPSDIAKYRACLAGDDGQRDGGRMNRMERLNERVYLRFQEARNASQPVHDYHIRNWGLQVAEEIGAPSSFTASHTWILSFKRRYRIGSRAVTGYTSSAEKRQQDSIEASKLRFWSQFERLEPFVRRRLIINVDQTAFNYEMTNKRTLNRLGERDVVINVESKSKTTHSYTSQPMITRDGKTFGKLLLCLREPSGAFGPIVAEKVKKDEEDFKNIRVFASKSGKMDKQLMRRWIEEVLGPALEFTRSLERNVTIANNTVDDSSNDSDLTDIYDLRRVGLRELDDYSETNATYSLDDDDYRCSDQIVDERPYCWDSLFSDRCIREAQVEANQFCNTRPHALLLADSWTGQTHEDIRTSLRRHYVKMLQIPKGTTDKLQPLDVFFNRQYKKFVKRLTEKALQDDILQEITSRHGIINMHSLIWNQFSSERYQDMIRNAWRNTDPNFSRDELSNPTNVKVVQQIQLDVDASLTCQATNCSAHAFIKCSHCGKLLCLKHFLERVCFHENETDHHDGDMTNSSHDSDRTELRKRGM